MPITQARLNDVLTAAETMRRERDGFHHLASVLQGEIDAGKMTHAQAWGHLCLQLSASADATAVQIMTEERIRYKYTFRDNEKKAASAQRSRYQRSQALAEGNRPWAQPPMLSPTPRPVYGAPSAPPPPRPVYGTPPDTPPVPTPEEIAAALPVNLDEYFPAKRAPKYIFPTYEEMARPTGRGTRVEYEGGDSPKAAPASPVPLAPPRDQWDEAEPTFLPDGSMPP